jgi:hypothetical protein
VNVVLLTKPGADRTLALVEQRAAADQDKGLAFGPDVEQSKPVPVSPRSSCLRQVVNEPLTPLLDLALSPLRACCSN